MVIAFALMEEEPMQGQAAGHLSTQSTLYLAPRVTVSTTNWPLATFCSSFDSAFTYATPWSFSARLMNPFSGHDWSFKTQGQAWAWDRVLMNKQQEKCTGHYLASVQQYLVQKATGLRKMVSSGTPRSACGA